MNEREEPRRNNGTTEIARMNNGYKQEQMNNAKRERKRGKGDEKRCGLKVNG